MQLDRLKSPRVWRVVAVVALSVAFTWPLGNLVHPVLAEHDDPLFSTWRLAWVAHQLPRDIWNLFDANIFYPVDGTLAYSDAMLLLGLAGAPFIWLGVPPVIVHNLLAIAAFVTAALAMAKLAAYFTPSVAAQMIAGIVFAFAPYRGAHIVHLELLWTAFLPLALLALYRLLEQPSPGRAVWLGTCVGLQALCSIYYGVFLVLWLIPAFALAPLHVPIQWTRRHAAALAVSLATTVMLVSPYVVPYTQARAALGPRSDHDLQLFSARLSDYLQPSPHNRLYDSEARLEQDERSLYVGAIAMALCAFACLFVRSRTTAICAVLTAIAIDLSLGVHGLVFPLLRSVLPMLDALRAPSRFAVFAVLGAALLAALGTTRLLGLVSGVRRPMIATAMALSIVAEYWAAPISSHWVPIVPGQAHAWLAAQPRTVVATLPLPRPGELWGYEPLFQYLSIFHWQPMVNGYSGHVSQAYFDLIRDVADFPSDAAINALRNRGVQVLLFHERYGDRRDFDRYLYACNDAKWFSAVKVFQDYRGGRSAICRLAQTSSTAEVASSRIR
jgi:hypothetical protein